MRRDLGDGFELDDDPTRIDVDAASASSWSATVEEGPYKDTRWLLHTRDARV